LLVLWALPSEQYTTTFKVTSTAWTPILSSLDVVSGGPALRAQIYLQDLSPNKLEIDATGNSTSLAPN